MSSVDNTRFPALAVAISLVIGTLSAVPYLGYRFEYYPGDVLDARLVMYLLEHGYRWISGQTQGSFLDAPFYYPVRGVISYSENLLGVLPFYAPWRMLGYDRETAFQVWTAIGFLLNYSAAAWVMSNIAELAPCGPQAVMICVPWYEIRFGAAAARCSQLTAVGESAFDSAGTAAADAGRPNPIRAVLTRTASRDRLTGQRPVRATGWSVEVSPAYPEPL